MFLANLEISAEPNSVGWIGIVWDKDEDGAKSCIALTETLSTRKEALKWARRYAEDIMEDWKR